MESVSKILGFPTTISRALARVTATLNLWTTKERVTIICKCRLFILCVCVWDCVIYLLVFDKAQVELFVHLCVIGAASNCRHQNHSPLLALELLHWTNLTHTHKYAFLTHLLLCFEVFYSPTFSYLKVFHTHKLKFFFQTNFFQCLADFLHLCDTKKNITTNHTFKSASYPRVFICSYSKGL